MTVYASSRRFWLLSCCGVLGCTDVDLGQAPEFLWWTDHESGDLSAWVGDRAGSSWTAEGGTLDVVSNPTRSGRFAIRSTVTATNNPARTSCALVSRTLAAPSEAFYSAWFYIPEGVSETQYWLFFKFRAPNESPPTELWDLDLDKGDADSLPVRLYHHDSGDAASVDGRAHTVPVARWFQAEAFFRATDDSSGRLTIWIDGTMVFDVAGATAPTSGFEWSLGGATEAVTPNSVSLYFDDAAITTQRLGPDFPAFWRGS